MHLAFEKWVWDAYFLAYFFLFFIAYIHLNPSERRRGSIPWPPSAHYELFLHYCVPLSGWWIMWFMAEINSYRNHCTHPATRTRNAARRCTKWMKLVSWEPSLISEPRLISPKRLKFEEFEALPENTDHISGRRIFEMEMESYGRWNITKWQCRWGINDSGEAKNLITIQV